MDIQVLKNFLLVAQEENITRASEILHISQPTLSRQIQNLEEEFGQPLFVRNNKKVRLTSQGILLKRRAGEIIELYQKTHNEINPTPGIVSGDIRFVANEAFMMKAVFDLGKQFQMKYPMTKFRVFSSDNATAAEMLSSGIADFGILFGSIDEKQFDCIRIAETANIGILMPVGHRLAEKKALNLEDLEGYPLIFHQDSVNRLPGAYRSDFEGLEFKATYNMLLTAVEMVRSGLGIAIVLDNMINFESNDLVTRPLSNPMNISSFLVWKKYGVLPKQSSLFLDMLTEKLRSDT